ncbi:MAG TPA: HAD family hydrolase [Planctomycetaceae bacterium]|nr:HAD family hydrolase [Planctomycetaceae bacterium]
MPFQAVVFDLDGTLLDTLADIGNSANRVLEEFGFPAHPLDRYRHFVGEGVARLFERALPVESVRPERIAQCVDAFRRVYREHWNDTTRPYPGVPELLAELTDRGLRLAVLSNKPDEFTRLCIDRHFPGREFAAVVGQQAGLPCKPDPAGALLIARRMAIPAEQFAYLGDSAVDMQTARAAGMHAVGAAWGFRSVDELHAGGAERIIERPEELIAVIDVH